ncbi:MAG: diguanylate cyclase [Planctomycetes bacterium]|nr:diguanylate cyclase [Planctomycetota bacterium]
MIGTKFLSRQPKWLVFILGLLVIAVIHIIDYSSVKGMVFSPFYLLPIYLATWFVGTWAGIVMSVVSSISWLVHDVNEGYAYAGPVITYWNMVARLLLYFIVTHILSALKASLHHERRLARSDNLTGVSNNLDFTEITANMMARANQEKKPLSVAFLDVDDFKSINDRFGHSAGDKLLRLAAEAIRKNIRPTDLVSRNGGDEFVILIADSGADEAREIVQRVNRGLLSAMKENKFDTTFSIGLVTCNTMPCSLDEMLKLADNLMYQAKAGGKNSIKSDVFGDKSCAPEKAIVTTGKN